jgi:hypothetical protein
MAWKPKEGEEYYFINATDIQVYRSYFQSSIPCGHTQRFKHRNCFRTKSAAQKVAKQFKKILKESEKE